ncbi:MAG TPA: thioredoxin [Methylophilaceae bacterium]|nr:thioredoxin [Methylophilaceae bacterium]HAJ72095.1 thioredoxin [Methylophilaceae bacterium]
MMILKKILIPLVVAGLIALLFFSLAQKPKAPEVTFTTIEGKKISMESLKGKVFLVNFWATDCPGCIKEIPNLVETYKAYQNRGFEIIAVAMPYDPPAQVLNYAKLKTLPFPVMHDGFSEITQAFGGINLTPTTYIFDKQGYRIQRTIGEIDFNNLKQLLNKELN